MATRNALSPSFEVLNFTDTYLGKLTKFQFNCFRSLGACRSPIRIKNLCTKFSNRCCRSTVYQIFLIQIAFQSSHWVELVFLVAYKIRISLNVKSEGTKNSRLSPGGLTTPKISDGKHSFKFIQSKVQNSYKMLSSFSHNVLFNIADLKNFAYS